LIDIIFIILYQQYICKKVIIKDLNTHQRIWGFVTQCATQIHVLLTYLLYIRHTATLPCKY